MWCPQLLLWYSMRRGKAIMEVVPCSKAFYFGAACHGQNLVYRSTICKYRKLLRTNCSIVLYIYFLCKCRKLLRTDILLCKYRKLLHTAVQYAVYLRKLSQHRQYAVIEIWLFQPCTGSMPWIEGIYCCCVLSIFFSVVRCCRGSFRRTKSGRDAVERQLHTYCCFTTWFKSLQCTSITKNRHCNSASISPPQIYTRYI